MKPAPNATKCSIRTSSRAARRVTASAPTTLPSAATRAYPKALDTGQEIIARVAARILEHFREQPLEGLSHLGPGPHACGQEVVALHREILDREGVLRRPHAISLLEDLSRVSSEAGSEARNAVMSTGSRGSLSTAFHASRIPPPGSRISGSHIRAAPTSIHSVSSFETRLAVAIPLNHSSRTRSAESCANPCTFAFAASRVPASIRNPNPPLTPTPPTTPT